SSARPANHHPSCLRRQASRDRRRVRVGGAARQDRQPSSNLTTEGTEFHRGGVGALSVELRGLGGELLETTCFDQIVRRRRTCLVLQEVGTHSAAPRPVRARWIPAPRLRGGGGGLRAGMPARARPAATRADTRPPDGRLRLGLNPLPSSLRERPSALSATPTDPARRTLTHDAHPSTVCPLPPALNPQPSSINPQASTITGLSRLAVIPRLTSGARRG